MVNEVGTQSQNAIAKMALRSLEECENSTLQWCKIPRLVKVFILRRGVVFTSKVRMTHVNRRWKAYQQGARISDQNLSMEQQSANDDYF